MDQIDINPDWIVDSIPNPICCFQNQAPRSSILFDGFRSGNSGGLRLACASCSSPGSKNRQLDPANECNLHRP